MLQAVLDAPRRNASCEVDRFEVAQGMGPMCTQNPWAITAVLLRTCYYSSTAVYSSSTAVPFFCEHSYTRWVTELGQRSD